MNHEPQPHEPQADGASQAEVYRQLTDEPSEPEQPEQSEPQLLDDGSGLTQEQSDQIRENRAAQVFRRLQEARVDVRNAYIGFGVAVAGVSAAGGAAGWAAGDVPVWGRVALGAVEGLTGLAGGTYIKATHKELKHAKDAADTEERFGDRY